MKVTKLVIDREFWGTDSLLNSEDTTMCCLGFLALACGAAPDEIEDEGNPSDVPNVDWPAAFIVRKKSVVSGESHYIDNSSLTKKAIAINDHPNMKWKVKEKKLIPLFKLAGIKLSFKGPPKKDG